MGTRIHGNTSYEPLTTFLGRTIDLGNQFCAIMAKFGYHGNSLGSFENLDSIFEFNNPLNPTIHAKNSSISGTELKFLRVWLIFV